jgi:hypothetical protein
VAKLTSPAKSNRSSSTSAPQPRKQPAAYDSHLCSQPDIPAKSVPCISSQPLTPNTWW